MIKIIKIITVFLIVILISCNHKTQKDPEKDLFEPSYKELKNKEGFVEFYDSINGVYSNFKYNVAIKKPKNWKFDFGVDKYTIFKAIEIDSGYSYSLAVIETKYNVEEIFWNEYNKNKKEIEKQLKYSLEKKVNTDVEQIYSKTTYLKNYKGLKHKYNYVLRDQDYSVDMTCIMVQIPKKEYTYTITLIIPKVFFDERENYYEDILNSVYWLSDKEDSKAILLK